MRILPYELFGSYSKRNLLFEEFIPSRTGMKDLSGVGKALQGGWF